MISDLQVYTKAAVYVNGSLLIEEASITINRDTNSHPIHTIARGYAGEAAGSPLLEISVENAVPSLDFEMDPGQFMGNMQEVQFAVFAAGRTLNFSGFILSDNFSHAVETESKLNFKARGFYTNWI